MSLTCFTSTLEVTISMTLKSGYLEKRLSIYTATSELIVTYRYMGF